MKFIDIILDGVTVRAQLNETDAPQTAKALWANLPFGGEAMHGKLSGQMFGLFGTPLEHPEVENASYFQEPGVVFYDPAIDELGFSVGEARAMGTLGVQAVTPVGELEYDFADFTRKGEGLLETGNKPIWVQESADQKTPLKRKKPEGKRFRLSLANEEVDIAVFNKDLAAAMDGLLSEGNTSGKTVNLGWGGEILDLCVPGLTTTVSPDADTTTFTWPGYLYLEPITGQLLFCYGPSQYGKQGIPLPLIAVGQVDGDVKPLGRAMRSRFTSGAQEFQLSLPNAD